MKLSHRHTLPVACTLVTLLVCGCQSASYYGQAVFGQIRIMMAARPIDDVLRDSSAPQALKESLSFVLALRAFAEQTLMLPVGRNYLTYADIDRAFVVWNVFAAPELALTPKTWCYPIVGCAAYRGYFAEKNAKRYALDLQKQGYDTFVSGALAYSTLGWFDDPVLSTFVRLDKARLGALIFHELAHRILYVPGDVTFSESFATAVEEEGLRQWAMAQNTPDILADYERHRRNHGEFLSMIRSGRRELERVYSSDLPADQKKARKTELIFQLKREFGAATEKAPGMDRYQAWFGSGLNNAALAAVSAYHDLVPAFRRLLQASKGDLASFFETCRSLSRIENAERNRRMQALIWPSP